MNVAILTIGNEVTSGEIQNTNCQWLAEQVSLLGYEVLTHISVRDDRQEILDAFSYLSKSHQWIFVTGGLGPTTDDLTRPVLAEFLNAELVEDPATLESVRIKLDKVDVNFKEGHRRQAAFPKGATILDNQAGTANGFIVEANGGGDETNRIRYVVLPGPPRELKSCWQNGVLQKLKEESKGFQKKLRYWRCLGIGESDLADIVEEVFKGTGTQLGYRASHPYVIVKVWTDKNTPENLIEDLEGKISSYLVSRGMEDPLDQLLESFKGFDQVKIFDGASGGALGSRLHEVSEKWRRQKLGFPNIQLVTNLTNQSDGLNSNFPFEKSRNQNSQATEDSEAASKDHSNFCELSIVRNEKNFWEISLITAKGEETREVEPPLRYRHLKPRAGKFAAEMAIKVWNEWCQALFPAAPLRRR